MDYQAFSIILASKITLGKTMMTPSIDDIKTYLLKLQKQICDMLEAHETQAELMIDEWESKLGKGRTCVLSDGTVIEQGGVNFSHVSGSQLPASAVANRPNVAGKPFEAMGVSVVIHPRNPYIPTSHFNVRFFVADKDSAKPIWWFGGGFDLTPYYGNADDCVDWHKQAKAACDPFGSDLYPRFKQWADEYFFLKHRNETRGIGGIFFDDFDALPLDQGFALIQSVGKHYIDAYHSIIAKHKNRKYGNRQRDFQLYRRGRYVEFNLLYDRGTMFGLQSGGRTESILMSLPPEVNWRYNWHPEPDSAEAALYENFLGARDWLAN